MPDSWHDERFLRSSVLVIVDQPGDEARLAAHQMQRFRGQVSLLFLRDQGLGAWASSLDAPPHRTLRLSGATSTANQLESLTLQVLRTIDDWQPKFVLAQRGDAIEFAARHAILLRERAGALPPHLVLLAENARPTPASEVAPDYSTEFATIATSAAAALASRSPFLD